MTRKNSKEVLVFSLLFLLVFVFCVNHVSAQGKKQIPAWICMEVMGEIDGGVYDGSGWSEACACNNIPLRDSGKHQAQLVVRPVDYDLSYFQAETFKTKNDGAECFRDGLYLDLPLVVAREEDGNGGLAWVRFTFYAYANDGETVVHYGLDMFGDFEGNYPPQAGETTTIGLTNWEMSSWGRGKLKHISCTGSGEFSGPTIVEVTNHDGGECPN